MNKIVQIFLFFVVLKSCDGFKKTVPVLVIDNDSAMAHVNRKANPLKATSSDDFTNFALDAVKHARCIVIIITETLCTEDLSSKDEKGTPFYNLQNGIKEKKVIYIPAVNEPFTTLQQIFEPEVSNTFHLGFNEELKILDPQIKHFYVYLKEDLDVSRVENLRQHDSLIHKVHFMARQIKSGPIIAFYTGKRNSITLAQLKNVPIEPLEEEVTIQTSEALFRLEGVFTSPETRRSFHQDSPVVAHEMRTRSSLVTTMQVASVHLQFNFELEEKQWILANIALLEEGEEVGRTTTHISAPWQRSYFCTEPITVVSQRDGTYVTISKYQVEPLAESRRRAAGNRRQIKPGNVKTPKISEQCSFSKSVNCSPYFSAGIIACLLVFIIFLIITLWGVIMLHKCGSPNKFDTFGQKPLVIAQEQGSHGH